MCFSLLAHRPDQPLRYGTTTSGYGTYAANSTMARAMRPTSARGRPGSIDSAIGDARAATEHTVPHTSIAQTRHAATPLGREVAEITARSAAFFEGVLGKLVAADWEGGYATNCVTAKSGTGKRLLGELAPGLFHQTGCNGAGAAAALAWGGEVAEAVAGALERGEGR